MEPLASSSAQRPAPVLRRNSFSRDAVASIALTRQTSDELLTRSDIGLHLVRVPAPSSPRKSASFSHPRSPAQEDGVGSPTSLRSSQSAMQLRQLTSGGSPEETKARTKAFVLENADIDAVEVDDPEDVDDGSDDASSAASSPMSVVRDDDDTFETWLHEAQAASKQQAPVIQYLGADSRGTFMTVPESLPVTDERTESFSQELAEWLRRERSASLTSSSVDLARSVQQIEEDIRAALDSAATRVAQELHRRDLFEQELRAAGAGDTDVAVRRDDIVPSRQADPAIESCLDESSDLLLLMDVVIGDGRSETIEVRVGDRPESLAAAFAAKHGLAAESVPRLTQHIEEQLDALAAEMAEETQTQAQQRCRPLPDQREYVDAKPAVDLEQVSTTPQSPPPVSEDVMSPPPPPTQQTTSPQAVERRQREFEREHKYNTFMERYGHYTSHSGKVNPTTGAASAHTTALTPSAAESRGVSPVEPLTLHNIQLAERTRLSFVPARSAGGDKYRAKEDASVFNRLYALAESRDKWIRRQQKAKRAEEMKEQESMAKLELAAKSKHLVAHRTNGGYTHIGERLYEEALAEMAKRDRDRERRAIEREQQFDWTCAKCAFVNQYNDDVCKNVVSTAGAGNKARRSARNNSLRGSSGATSFMTPETLAAEAICGHPRPDQLFRPTLLSAPPAVARALKQYKQRAGKAASQRRERSQKAMEDEFRETCPFRPKINEVSEEIMREKLEQEAKNTGVEVAFTRSGDVRRKNPFQALYEDAFHAKAQREAREEAYLKQFPFKPNIGVNALWSTASAADTASSVEDVVHRLAVERYQELELKRQSLHEKYAPDRDPVTGREYFKPETGRAPVFNRNERGLPIGDFLYEAHKEHEDYLRRLHQQALQQVKAQRQQCFLSDTSKQALEARKKKTFGRIFDFLRRVSRPQREEAEQPREGDSTTDADPRVVPADVVTEELPPEIAHIVGIAFEFASHQPFSRAEFESYMEKLMAEVPGLTYTQMLFLTENLPDGRSARRSVYDKTVAATEPEAELTFRPTIDKNSDLLARKHGRAERAKVFEALNQYFEHYKDRKEQARKLVEREFARQHPFQPTFYTKDRQSRGSAFYEKLRQANQEPAHSASRSRTDEIGHSAPPLSTAVANARPYVRPIDSDDIASPLIASRSDSFASSKQFVDDEDAALTSHVLAALDERSSATMVPTPSTQIATAATSPSASSASTVGPVLPPPAPSVLSTLFPSGHDGPAPATTAPAQAVSDCPVEKQLTADTPAQPLDDSELRAPSLADLASLTC